MPLNIMIINKLLAIHLTAIGTQQSIELTTQRLKTAWIPGSLGSSLEH